MAKRDIKVSISVTSSDIAETLSEVLRRKLSGLRKPAAQLARTYGWGDRKSKAVYEGTLAPTSADLVNLMATDDDVFDKVIEMTGRRADWEKQRKAIREILEGKS